ncbi:MAG: esterase [Algicola sp.]|nr:esterase [Algicola sp.]
MFGANAVEVWDLNPIEKLSISSKLYEGTIDFSGTLPPNYAKNTDKRYVVLFDFHTRAQPMLTGMHDWMSHNGEWPWLETIVVTPATYSKLLGPVYEDGAQLLDFFEHDLLKALDKNYRTNGFRIYSGFTGNGSAGLYTLLNRPSLFNAYIIASPVLADDHRGLMSSAEQKLKKLTDKPRYLFMSNGTSRYEQPHQDSFTELKKILQTTAPKQLTWQTKAFEGTTYMSQPVLAVVHAIEAIFSDIHNTLAADSVISRQGAQAILKHYRYLSEQKFGFEVSAEDALTALGKSLMKDNPKKALTVFKISVDTYPESAWAIHALADAYAQLKQFDKALDYQKQAREKANSMGGWHQNKHQQFLEEYQAALKG